MTNQEGNDEFDLGSITYVPSLCDTVNDMMEVGATVDDVIKVIGISKDTLIDWRNRYPEFDEAIKEGLIYSEAWISLERKTTLK